MPVYPFVCMECGREFSLALSAEQLDEKQRTHVPCCPNCASRHVECLVTTSEAVGAEAR